MEGRDKVTESDIRESLKVAERLTRGRFEGSRSNLNFKGIGGGFADIKALLDNRTLEFSFILNYKIINLI